MLNPDWACLFIGVPPFATWDAEHVVSMVRTVVWPILLTGGLIAWRRQVGAILERLARLESLEVAGLKMVLTKPEPVQHGFEIEERIERIEVGTTRPLGAPGWGAEVREKVIPIRLPAPLDWPPDG